MLQFFFVEIVFIYLLSHVCLFGRSFFVQRFYGRFLTTISFCNVEYSSNSFNLFSTYLYIYISFFFRLVSGRRIKRRLLLLTIHKSTSVRQQWIDQITIPMTTQKKISRIPFMRTLPLIRLPMLILIVWLPLVVLNLKMQ